MSTPRTDGPSLLPHAPRGILVFQPGRYGDMVLTTPLLRGLAENYPDSKLNVLASAGPSDIAAHLPFVHRVIAAPRGARRILTLIRAVTLQKHDLYVDPKDHASTTSQLLARYARAGVLVVAAVNAHRRRHVIPIPTHAQTLHYVDVMVNAIRALGIDPPRRLPELTLPETTLRGAMALRREIGDYLVVNLSSGARGRLWPESRWLDLVANLGRDRTTVLVASGPESAVAERICRSVPSARHVPTPGFLDAAAIVSQGSGIITPDTSLVHVASAFDIPTVALYPAGSENLARFAPLSVHHAALTPLRGESIEGITLTEVLNAVDAVLIR